MEKKAHVLAIACPAQGHVISFLNFCNKIAAQGIKVTFVNTEFIHSRIMASMKEDKKNIDFDDGVRLVSIPDGLHDLTDRMDPLKILESLKRVMPGHVFDLIDQLNQSNPSLPITAVIADLTIGWILDVAADKIGAQKFGFWSSGPASLAFFQTLNLNNHGVEGKINNTFPKEMLGLGCKFLISFYAIFSSKIFTIS